MSPELAELGIVYVNDAVVEELPPVSVSTFVPKLESPGPATYQYTLLKAVVVDKPIVTLPPADALDEPDKLADGVSSVTVPLHVPEFVQLHGELQ